MNQKNKIIAIMFLMVATFSYSQNEVEYYYDNAGNRVQRGVVVMESSKMPGSINEKDNSQKPDDSEFKLYPNTTQGIITVEVDNVILEEKNKEIFLSDLNGKQLIRKRIENKRQLLDLSNLASGSYLVKIMGPDKVYAEWRVIKR